MATIAENLQIIKNSVEEIKQAIIDKGGIIDGDITTYANAISELSDTIPNTIVYSAVANENNRKIYDYLVSLTFEGLIDVSINRSGNTITVTNYKAGSVGDLHYNGICMVATDSGAGN